MGYPNWLIGEIVQRGWQFKKEAKKYKVYQSPDSPDRILIHKHTNIDERVVRGHLRKIGMKEDAMQSFVAEHVEHIIKSPASKK